MGFGNALNAVGDTRFHMVISLFSMWCVAAGLSYVLGLHFGWGLAGIYVAMICDEYLRGIIVAIRWRRKKYLRLAEGRAKGVEVGRRSESGDVSVHSV
ncbi:MATE family multidrug exporter [compost metagenome]